MLPIVLSHGIRPKATPTPPGISLDDVAFQRLPNGKVFELRPDSGH